MYDFYFNTKKEIQKNPENFLLFVKKLLPRWLNGIPDSECLAIFKILNDIRKKKKRNLILTETGCGASTVAIFLHCALYGGRMFSWDINSNKGSYLKSIISDSICKVLNVDIHKIWTFISSSSTDPFVGLIVLKEMKLKSDFCFFDTEHTLKNVMNELNDFLKISEKSFVVAFDDAYYQKRYVNFVFTNIIRTKLNLKRIKEPKSNISKPLYTEVQNFLKKNFRNVNKINDFYKSNYLNDSWFSYYKEVKDFGLASYDKDFDLKNENKKKHIQHRFDAFYVIK
jgi:hypothetical protein